MSGYKSGRIIFSDHRDQQHVVIDLTSAPANFPIKQESIWFINKIKEGLTVIQSDWAKIDICPYGQKIPSIALAIEYFEFMYRCKD